MRTELKDQAYFERYAEEIERVIERSKTWLSEGTVAPDRVNIVKDDIRSYYLKRTILKFSAGSPIGVVKESFNEMIEYMDESWIDLKKLKIKDRVYDQYILSGYDEMLWMLSLGYLFEIDDARFNKMIQVIESDNVKDILFEFIISKKTGNMVNPQKESYSDFFYVPNVYEKLRLAIQQVNKLDAQNLIKEFLKEWYSNHKEAGWYNAHKSKHDAFFGYWSFESAAVVKMMELNDESFRDSKYYPKDLV